MEDWRKTRTAWNYPIVTHIFTVIYSLDFRFSSVWCSGIYSVSIDTMTENSNIHENSQTQKHTSLLARSNANQACTLDVKCSLSTAISFSLIVCQKTSSSNMYSFQIKQTKFINLRDAKSSLTQPICSSCEQHQRGWISPSLTSLIEQITHIDGAEQQEVLQFCNFHSLSRLTIVEETLLFAVVYACTVELRFAYLPASHSKAHSDGESMKIYVD